MLRYMHETTRLYLLQLADDLRLFILSSGASNNTTNWLVVVVVASEMVYHMSPSHSLLAHTPTTAHIYVYSFTDQI